MATNSHNWRFFRAGGFDQVKLETGADLMHLDQLDQKLWVALACPVNGLEFDSQTLAIIDTDHDGRVRAAELINAVKWAGSLLKDPDELVRGTAALPLAAINDSTPEGKTLLNSARQILINLGKPDATAITLADTADTAKIFAQTAFNGDGIIVEESAHDDATKEVIRNLIACHGVATDRSGKQGTNQPKVDQFFADLTAYDLWVKRSEAEAARILPLGEATAAGYSAFHAVRAKIDDYFGRCRLTAYDSRVLAILNRKEDDYLPIAAKDLSLTASEVAGFPLAHVAAGRPLSLRSGINPAWVGPLAAFETAVVKPVLGDKAELTEADWAVVVAKFAPFQAWQAEKAGAAVEPLGLTRIRQILASKAREELAALIAQDRAEEGNANAIASVDKLIRYHRDLHLLCLNFVSFKDFYDRGEPAIFQAGTLYLDQRSCHLCLTVEDPAKHAAMAALAGSYLAYVDCARKGSGEKLSIVAAFTDGDSDNLMVGRNGIFYDRKGRDWDATITKVIDNPISVRQAFWSPYKKLVRFIEEQVAKRASAADSAANDKLLATAQQTANADKAAKETPPAKKFDVGVIAALGVAFGSIGTFLAAILTKFIGLSLLELLGVVVGIILLISGPSMIIAYLKLRKRSLGPLLDANGWAINSKARVNVPFGTSLTDVAELPPGAQRDTADPFAEKQRPWGIWILLLVLLFLGYKWYIGDLDRKLPGMLKSTTVMGAHAPAAEAAREPAATKAPAPAESAK